MRVQPCRFTGDPLAVAICQRSAAIKRGGEFQGDEGAACANAAEEAAIEGGGFGLAHVFANGDASGAQAGNALTGHKRVGVAAGNNGAGDTSGDERIGAGRGAAMMRAGFEGDVGSGTTGGVARCAQGVCFGVWFASVLVPAFADGNVVFDEDAADAWVRGGGVETAPREVQRALHPVGIVVHGG